jgi:hypothetical protein
MNFNKDYLFGITQENSVSNKIELYFNDILTPTSRYCKYDFKGSKYLYELKSRNNKYSQFPTTLIAKDKVLDNPELPQVFIFNFTDGLYYIKYDKIVFDGFDCLDFKRRARDDKVDIEKLYYYIPIINLTKI